MAAPIAHADRAPGEAAVPDHNADRGPGGLAASTGSGTAPAVDQMIDLQSRSVGLTFTPGTRPAERGIESRPAVMPMSRPRPADERLSGVGAGGLYGAGAAPEVTARPSADAGRLGGVETRRRVSADNYEVRRGADGDNVLQALLPVELLQYLRENRLWLVVVGAVALGVFWAASVLIGKRLR